MKKQLSPAVTAIVIIIVVVVVAVLYFKLTGPQKFPATARTGPGGASLSPEERAQRQLENFDKMTPAEREKYRTGAPGMRTAWKRWAEARGVPIPAEEPPPVNIRRGTQPRGAGAGGAGGSADEAAPKGGQ